jgi:hypothetical protein
MSPVTELPPGRLPVTLLIVPVTEPRPVVPLVPLVPVPPQNSPVVHETLHFDFG